jgi:hypothetical protein
MGSRNSESFWPAASAVASAALGLTQPSRHPERVGLAEQIKIGIELQSSGARALRRMLLVSVSRAMTLA